MENCMTLRSSIYAAAVVVLLGIIPGEMFKLYDRIPYFDKGLHLIGGFVLAMLLTVLLSREQKTMSPYAFVLMILGSATLIGVLWEQAEYLSGYFTKDWLPLIYRYFHGGNLRDTLGDLAFDILGSLLFLELYMRSSRLDTTKRLF
jgi:hypothetical protein